MMAKLMTGMMAGVVAMPIVAQLPAETTLERLGKGTTQMVLAVVVIGLALALIQIFRYHRQDTLASKKELLEEMERSKKDMREQWERSQKVISDNTTAMNMMANSNEQLKEAIYHLSTIIDKKVKG
jgi:uncharacterized ion transporter superfamily protein YfcC